MSDEKRKPGYVLDAENVAEELAEDESPRKSGGGGSVMEGRSKSKRFSWSAWAFFIWALCCALWIGWMWGKVLTGEWGL